MRTWAGNISLLTGKMLSVGPMLLCFQIFHYRALDTGNFFVIPGSPIDAWATESYSRTHSRSQLREGKGFSEQDMLILVVGSSFFYNELSWDYAVSMHNIGPLLLKMQGGKMTECHLS